MPASVDFTIHQLRVFVAVAQHGSFSRAASAMDIPQPALSRIVGRIEDVAGMRLMHRSARGVALNEAGKLFLKRAEQVLHHHELALVDLNDLRGKLVGEVRIAAPESVGNILFAPLVQAFKSAHEAAQIRTVSAQSTAIPVMLDNGTIDVGIVADTHPSPAWRLEPLFREAFYLIGPADAEEVSQPDVPLERVAALPLILNALPGGFRSLFDNAFAQAGLTPNVRIEIDANMPLLDLVLDGEGFALLPLSAVTRKYGRIPVAASRVIDPTLQRTLSIVTAPDRPVTPVWTEAIRQIREIVRAKSDEVGWMPSSSYAPAARPRSSARTLSP